MGQALISPNVLKWARIRSRLDHEVLAQKTAVKVEKLSDWESGNCKPTFIQAQKLARVLNIPFGYLFLKEPPIEKILLPDLRTVNDDFYSDYSPDLKDAILSAQFKQDWYREHRIEEEYPEIEFVGKFKESTDSNLVVKEINKLLNLSIEDRKKAKNWEDFFRLLVSRAESIGLWVIKSSFVGNNTHRIFEVNEFRGFVITDKYAPIIFINGADAKAAQIFTLIHEIAHLFFGYSGVSNVDIGKITKDRNGIELKCNEIAAEVLVPELLLRDSWNKKISLEMNAESLCKFFKVSSIVIARRALDLDLTSKEEFFSYYKKLKLLWENQRKKIKAQDGGPDYYVNVPIRNGQQFSIDVLRSVYSRKTLMRDGAQLLEITPTTLEKFAKKAGVI